MIDSKVNLSITIVNHVDVNLSITVVNHVGLVLNTAVRELFERHDATMNQKPNGGIYYGFGGCLAHPNGPIGKGNFTWLFYVVFYRHCRIPVKIHKITDIAQICDYIGASLRLCLCTQVCQVRVWATGENLDLESRLNFTIHLLGRHSI